MLNTAKVTYINNTVENKVREAVKEVVKEAINFSNSINWIEDNINLSNSKKITFL